MEQNCYSVSKRLTPLDNVPIGGPYWAATRKRSGVGSSERIRFPTVGVNGTSVLPEPLSNACLFNKIGRNGTRRCFRLPSERRQDRLDNTARFRYPFPA